VKNPSLPLERWPSEDQQAWAFAIAPGGFLEDGGPAAHWRPATRCTNIHHYGRWLAFLAKIGRLTEKGLAERCDRSTVLLYIEQLRATVASTTLASSIVGLAYVLKSMAPAEDWKWLVHIANVLSTNQVPTQRKAIRVLPSDYIYAKALQELKRIDGLENKSKWDVTNYRNVLAIALTAAQPLRRRNLSTLRLGVTLLRRHDDGWVINIPGGETKNGRPIFAELPKTLTPFLDTYVRDVRPLLLRGSTGDALWINWYGGEMSAHAFYLRFVEATERLFGRPLSPHLLRDCAATSLAEMSSDHARIAQDLLGHAEFATTEENYIHSLQLEASKRINAALTILLQSVGRAEGAAQRTLP
jgi:integrase/recombinase XerD